MEIWSKTARSTLFARGNGKPKFLIPTWRYESHMYHDCDEYAISDWIEAETIGRIIIHTGITQHTYISCIHHTGMSTTAEENQFPCDLGRRKFPYYTQKIYQDGEKKMFEVNWNRNNQYYRRGKPTLQDNVGKKKF